VSRGTLDLSLGPSRFAYRAITLCCGIFQSSSATILPSVMLVRNPSASTGLGCFPFARRYLGNRFFFLFLGVLRCFSSPGLPLHTYFIEYAVLEGCSSRFPHSEISGSKPICDSPKHIGAYPVLHRLLVPRHSPYALNNLTFVT